MTLCRERGRFTEMSLPSRDFTKPRVFGVISAVPAVLFGFGWFWAVRQRSDDLRPAICMMTSVLLSGFGLLLGRQWILRARDKQQPYFGLVASTAVASLPLLFMIGVLCWILFTNIK